MRIVVAGSSGFLGTALRRAYERDGHQIVRLVRRPARTPDEVSWNPAGQLDPALLDGADVLVNLAGAGIGDRRWTRSYRELLLRSRTQTAAALALMAAKSSRPPRVFLSASGIRFYGIDRGDEPLTESTRPDPAGLLPAVAAAWEAATGPASAAGVPVCHLRIGLVLSRHGGVLPPLLRAFHAGLGGHVASGRDYWSYVSLADTIRAIQFLASQPGATGPYNITAPDPVPHKELMRLLGQALGRPAWLRVPRWAARAALGGIATEVFGSLRVQPARLTEAGFQFEHPDAASAIRAALA